MKLRSTMSAWAIALALLSCWTASLQAVTLDQLYPNWNSGQKRYVRISGNDSNDGQTASTAWRSLRYAFTQLAAGQTLVVGAGTYDESDRSLLQSINGSANNQTVIMADSTGALTGDAGPVILRAFSTIDQWLMQVNTSSYVIISGFTFVENPNLTLPNYDQVTDASSSTTYWSTTVQNQKWPRGIYSTTSNFVTVHNCNFTGFLYGYHLTDSNDCRILDCSVTNPRYMGFYSWRCLRMIIEYCTFTNPNPVTYTNSNFQIYGWNTGMTVTNCTFDNTGTWVELSKATGEYARRNHYQIHVNGVGNDRTNYTSNLGELTVTNCSFTKCGYIAAYAAWNRNLNISNCNFDDCRYAIHAHSENFTIDNNIVTRPDDSTYNYSNATPTDSWGIYATCFSAPTNHNLDPNWRTDSPNPGGTISNTQLINQNRALLIASDNLTLSHITIDGNIKFANDNRSAGVWERYCNGIEVGWNCSNMEFNDTQNITISDVWWVYLNNHSYGCKTTFRDITIENQWNGVNCSSGKAEYINCKISNNKEYGAYNWWMDEVIATNSEFINNASTDYSGWGFLASGKMIPRNPTGDWTTEYDMYGSYDTSVLRLENCKFNDTGLYGVGGSGGLWVGRYHKNNMTLVNNEVKNNHSYGAYFYNCDLELNNNLEFTAITGNWHGLHMDGIWQNQRGTYKISNYDISNNYHGLLSQYCYCELSNVRSHHNEHYGVYAYLAKIKYRNVTADFNTQGFMLHSNSHHDIRQITANDNSQHGVWNRLVEQWPATANYAQYPVYVNYDVQQVTCERNLYGFYIYGVEYDADAREYPAGMTYPLKNITCNNNRNRGMRLDYGWFDTSLAPLNIVCQDNGYLDVNGNKNGNGLEIYNPLRDISLTAGLGITCDSSVANSGVSAWNHDWRYNATASANQMSTPSVSFTVDGWNSAGAANWSTASDLFWDVTVKNVNTQGGHYIANPQGAVLCKDSTIQNGYRGVQLQWGWYEGRTDFAAPVQKPASVLLENTQLIGNYHGGFYCDAWTNWQADNKRVTIIAKNCSFNNTVYHGLLVYNNDMVIENCTANDNGGHALYVWGGNATLRNCSLNNNAAGRVNNADGVPQDVGWNAVYLGYPWTPTNDYPEKKYTYTLENCSVNNTEGYAVFFQNLGGTAIVQNCTIDTTTTSGTGFDFRDLENVTVTNSAATNVANHAFFGYGVDYVTYLNCTATNCLHGLSAYGKSEQQGNIWVASKSNATATMTNCSATDSKSGGNGVVAYYNSPTIRNCQILRNNSYGLLAASNINGTIENNTIQNNGYIGLRLDITGNAVIRNNVVTRNAYGIGLYENTTGNYKIWNNTVANNTNWGLYSQREATIDLSNNILANNGSWGAYFEANSIYTIAYNLVSGNTSGDYRHPNRTLAQLRSEFDVTKPPRFADATNGNYRPAKGSPAINAGTPSTDFTTDMIGQTRGTFRAWEIGAYEYTEADGSLRVLNWGEKR